VIVPAALPAAFELARATPNSLARSSIARRHVRPHPPHAEEQEQNACSALPHLVRHGIHHLGYAQAKDEANLGVRDLQDRVHSGEKCDGQKPSRATPHPQDNGNARIHSRGRCRCRRRSTTGTQ